MKSESPITSINIHVAAGDFNPVSNGFSTRIINTQCHLKQVIKKLTRNTAILDLTLIDIHRFYQDPLLLTPIGTSDHCTIVWSSQEQTQTKRKSKRINVKPLKLSSLQAFEQYIREYNWSIVLDILCTNDKVNRFLEVTSEMVDAYFPLKSVKIQEDDKPYIYGRIKQMIRKRDKAYQSGRLEQYK